MIITMPEAGSGIEISMIYKWNVCPGDKVRKGDNIAVIRTPQGKLFDLQIYENGLVSRLLVKENNMVLVGAAIASIIPDRHHGDGVIHPEVNLVEKYLSEPIK